MKVEKIELVHLAQYLPYGLNMKFENEKGRIITLTGITDQGEHGITITNGHGGMWLSSCGFKPLLRPLSQLTQEITHNGERFVPLVEFNKMRGVAVPDSAYTLESDGGDHYCYWGHTYQFSFEEQTMSFYSNLTSGISPQLKMFQKLHEWKFDLYSLIGSGLALELPL